MDITELPDEISTISDSIDTQKLFNVWMFRMRGTSASHYKMALILKRRHFYIASFNIVSAIFALFFSVSDGFFFETIGLEDILKVNLITLSCLLTVISAVSLYVLDLNKRSAKHEISGSSFADLARKTERYAVKSNVHPEAIHSLSMQFNMLTKSSPLFPKRIWRKATGGKLKYETTLSITSALKLGDNTDDPGPRFV